MTNIWGDKLVFREHNGNKVPALHHPGSKFTFEECEEAIKSYKWREEDFLLATYPKNGTHFVWEIMMMLLRGSAEYITDSKVVAMMELFPITKSDTLLPSPRVLNTHYRLDCLPDEFRGKKTVLVLRNPKDTFVSFYHMIKHMANMRLNKGAGNQAKMTQLSKMNITYFLQNVATDETFMYGSFWSYVECMWKMTNDPNMHVVYFEDLKRNPVDEITKLNEFMKTGRSPELITEIANQTSFSKMKKGKAESEVKVKEQILNIDSNKDKTEATTVSWSIYRKGDIGDWKNYFTVADNEAFDQMMKKWQKGKNIPFVFE